MLEDALSATEVKHLPHKEGAISHEVSQVYKIYKVHT